MSNQKSSSGNFKSVFASLAILISLAIGIIIYVAILGASGNFDAEGHPKPGNYLGMMYKGGFIVPILMGIFIIIVTFSIERVMTIAKAKGKGNVENFVRQIKMMIA